MGRKPNRREGVVVKKAIKRGRYQEEGTNVEVQESKKPRVPVERIKIVLHNARGFDEVTEHDTMDLIRNQKPEIVGILETHLREEDGSRNVDIPKGYSKIEVRRSDLADDKDGGGIMVVYKNAQGLKIEYKNLKIRNKENDFVEKERVWVTVKTKTEKMAVGFVYVAAENRAEKDKEKFSNWNNAIYEVLAEDVKKLRREGFKIIINGDMNGWVGCGLEGIPGNRKEINTNGLRFLDFLDRTGMVHLNGTPKCTGLFTRHSSNSSTVLDYVSVSKDDLPMIRSVFIDENSILGGNSDHVFVITTLEYAYTSGPAPTTKTRLATKWDMDEMTDWALFKSTQEELLREIPTQDWESAECLGDTLNGILVKALERGVGEKGVRERRPKCFPVEVKKRLKSMKLLRSEWRTLRSKTTKNPSNSNKQDLAEKEIKMNREKDKLDEVIEKFFRGKRSRVCEKLAEGGAASAKLFWTYVVNKSKGPQSFPFIQDPKTGEVKSDKQDVKQIVEEFLKNLFHGSFEPVEPRIITESDLQQGVDDDDEGENLDISQKLKRDFTEHEVGRMIAKLKNCKAMGKDKVPNEALKNSCPAFVDAIVKLFNKVKEEGKAPAAWKVGRLVLIHKKGALTDMGNYRPLTVIAAMSGLFSRVLNERLTEVVEKERILGEIQQGFRKDRRGADNTFVLNTIIMRGTATRKRPHLAFLDIKKVVFFCYKV